MRLRAAAAAAAGLALSLSGCGYALVGKGTVIDPTIKRIGVPLFRDASGKPGLDQKVTQRVVEELLKRGRFDVVPETTGVDALLEGEITNYTPRLAGVGGDEGGRSQANRYEIVLTARVRFSKVGARDPIWANDAFTFRDEYDVGDNPQAFIDQEGQAIDRLAVSFARSLVATMLEAF
jgi:outer membrane lipopolysaccharide assembly protein LptE/RlpB